MPIPLLEYAPSSQNHRVEGFEVPGDEHSRIYTTENVLSASELDILIVAAYRQIYNEQQMLSSNRQRCLESQLRIGQITVRDFIRGLALSDSFRRFVYESNNNYRFAEICVQRILGRNVYSEREKIAWSATIMTKGVKGFIDELLNSDEYLSNFGEDTVPYQIRRILPQRVRGEVTFAHMARYGTNYRDQLPKSSFREVQKVDGLFTQNERFDWETFKERANWPVVSGVLLLLFLSASGMLAIALSNQ